MQKVHLKLAIVLSNSIMKNSLCRAFTNFIVTLFILARLSDDKNNKNMNNS